MNDLRRVAVQLGTPHPFIGYKGRMSNGKFFPLAVTPFWSDSETPLLCKSCHCVRIFSKHVSTFCDHCLGMQSDPSLEENDRSDDDSMPPLLKRHDNESSDDDDDDSDEGDSGDDDDETTVSDNEFDDDINVVIKDINGDQCHLLLCPSVTVNLVKDQYFTLVGLPAHQQRLVFRGKMMFDENSMHSHGVVDGSIIHLVRRMRGGARTVAVKRKRIHVVSTSFGGGNKGGNTLNDKDNGGVVTVAKVVRKEEGGDFNSNHTVLLYFFFIMLLVFAFSFYSSLLFLFDTFLYYFIMYLITNRFDISIITSGALANFLNHISIGGALANFAFRTRIFLSFKQTIIDYQSVPSFDLRTHHILSNYNINAIKNNINQTIINNIVSIHKNNNTNNNILSSSICTFINNIVSNNKIINNILCSFHNNNNNNLYNLVSKVLNNRFNNIVSNSKIINDILCSFHKNNHNNILHNIVSTILNNKFNSNFLCSLNNNSILNNIASNYNHIHPIHHNILFPSTTLINSQFTIATNTTIEMNNYKYDFNKNKSIITNRNTHENFFLHLIQFLNQTFSDIFRLLVFTFTTLLHFVQLILFKISSTLIFIVHLFSTNVKEEETLGNITTISFSHLLPFDEHEEVRTIEPKEETLRNLSIPTDELLPSVFFAPSPSSIFIKPCSTVETFLPSCSKPPSCSVMSSSDPILPSLSTSSQLSSPQLLPRSKKRSVLRRKQSIVNNITNEQLHNDQDKEIYKSEIQSDTLSNSGIMSYLYNLLNFIYISCTSVYLFVIIKFLFISSIFWDTLLLFQLDSPKLKRKLRRKLKGNITIPSWVLTSHPRLWMILSTIMMHTYLPTPTSIILQQFQSSHNRINLLHNRVILSPLVVFDFQLQKFQQLFTTPVITTSNTNPRKPNNYPPTDFFNFDDLVTPSTDVDCSFLSETSDFISPQGFKAITENEVNSFMDCSSGMIDCFPVIFDSGASLAITPCKDDFVGEIKVPEKPLRLGGLALGLPINGKGTVEWSFKTATENVVIRTQAYYVPNCNVRLLSPQRLFNKDKGIIGEFTCKEEHASLQFQGVPNDMEINYLLL